MKLKTRIFLSIFLSSFLILTLIGGFLLHGFQKSTYNFLEEYNETASLFAQRIVYFAYDDDGIIDTEELSVLAYEFSQMQFGQDGYAYVIDTNGILIIHPASVGEDISDRPHIQKMMEGGEGSVRYKQTVPPNEGRIKEVYYRPIPELGWIVAAGPHLDDVQLEISTALMHFGLSMIVVFFINFFVAISLTKTIYSPIRRGSEQIHMLVHRINSKKLKKEITEQVSRITGDNAVDKTLDNIKKVTILKKHS